MAIESIRLPKQCKDQLIKLKRVTGIETWNVLCRWALCVSLAEPSAPPAVKTTTEDAVEMTWKVFAGEHRDVYMAVLKQRCHQDGLPVTAEVLATQLRLHLQRGIGYLFADRGLRTVAHLVARVRETEARAS